MPEWLAPYLPAGWTGTHLAIAGVVIFITTSLVSLLAVGFIIVRLPANYFAKDGETHVWPPNRLLRIGILVGSSLIGLLLIALGIVLSLPGVPGQGLLTILIGVMLLEFPGKRRFERWLATRRGILQGMNRLRARFGVPPMIAPSERQDPIA